MAREVMTSVKRILSDLVLTCMGFPGNWAVKLILLLLLSDGPTVTIG